MSAALLPGAVLVILACWGAVPASASAGYLFVWAGAEDGSKANDSLFVVDVVVTSKTFGRIVGSAPTPYSGMEPHHMTVSHDGKTVVAGGLLSVLSGKPNWWWFSVFPSFKSPTIIPGIEQPKYGACPDEVVALPNGGYLATMMGSSSGMTPGSLVVYSKEGVVESQYPSSAAASGFDGFNPHGVAIDTVRGTAASTDFIDPSSTLNMVPGGLVVRSTLRLWTFDTATYSNFKVVNVLDISKFNDAGLHDTKLIPHTGAYWFTSWGGVLYYVDPAHPTTSLKVVYNHTSPNGPQASMLATFRNATRLVMTCYSTSSVLLFDTTRPDKPKKLQELFLPAGSGAHHVVVNKAETMVSVATYFLEEGTFGKVHLDGDEGVHLLSINAVTTKLLPKKFLNFKTLLGDQGAFRPHSTGFSF